MHVLRGRVGVPRDRRAAAPHAAVLLRRSPVRASAPAAAAAAIPLLLLLLPTDSSSCRRSALPAVAVTDAAVPDAEGGLAVGVAAVLRAWRTRLNRPLAFAVREWEFVADCEAAEVLRAAIVAWRHDAVGFAAQTDTSALPYLSAAPGLFVFVSTPLVGEAWTAGRRPIGGALGAPPRRGAAATEPAPAAFSAPAARTHLRSGGGGGGGGGGGPQRV